MKRLGSMKNISEARYQLERLMKAHLEGEVETTTFRNLTYAFSIMLSYMKEEAMNKQDEKTLSSQTFLENLSKAMGQFKE